MDLKYLKSIVKIFDESSVVDITIEEEGTKIILSKGNQSEANTAPVQYMMPPPVAPSNANVQTPLPVASQETTPSDEENSSSHKIVSPIVGTYYGAPSPDSDPFIKVGDRIEVGQTLCIVEAMKLMNEIESDVAGVIEKINLSDGEAVEYGQVLFHINEA